MPESNVRVITQTHAETMQHDRQLEEDLPEQGVDQLIAEMDGCLVAIVSIRETQSTDSTKDKRKRRKLEWKEARLVMVRRPEEVSKLYNATMAGVERAGARNSR